MVNISVPAHGSLLGSILPARYVLAVLGSIGMAIVYGLKVNLSVAMVAMLNHTAIKLATPKAQLILIENITKIEHLENLVCPEGSRKEALEDGPFDWNEPLQGTILSCYFWGYFISQIPGARIAENFSAKWVMFFSIVLNIVCTLLTPFMANLDYIALITMRIGEGIGGGVTFPAMHVMLASWAPPDERSFMSSIIYAGTSLGTVASMLLAGILASNFGWESVFYVMGGLSCVWVILWVWLIQDSPKQQMMITVEERNFIITSLGEESEHLKPDSKPSIPWRKVFTSLPFLAILIAHTCSNWGWYMLLLELPFYMKQILKFNIKENATVTALPFLTMWFFSIALSKTLDTLRSHKKISTTTARKVATLIASVVPMSCLLALCYIGCKRGLAVILMGIGITSIGGMFSGFLSNHIDIAPRYAGTLIALTNTAATVPGIIVPLFVGEITHGNQTIDAWRKIFFVTVGLYIIEIFAYTILGSGEEQPWNKGYPVIELEENAEDEEETTEGTPLNTREAKMSYTDNE